MRYAMPMCSLALILGIGCTPAPAVDVDAERTALMEADRAWFEEFSTADDPAGAFVSRMTADANLLPPDAPLAEGPEAIRAVIGELSSMPGFSVTWGPTAADVGSGGDLGYTRGTYELSFDGPDGPVTIQGKYLTVWEKQADGTWMVTEDMFNADQAPGPSM